MPDSSIDKKTQQGTKWSVLTEVGAKVISPIVNMILARLLTPEAFGVVATVTMITSFADIFSDAGFQKFLIQHDFKNQDDFFKSTTVAFWTNLGISIVAWLIIFIFSDELAAFVGSPELGCVVWVASLSLPLTSFSSIQMAHYRKNFRFNVLFKVRMVGAVVPLFVTVPIAYFTRNYWALILGTLAGNLVNAIILTVWSKWKPTFYYSITRLKQMFAYSWWVLFESIVVWLTSYIGTFIVSQYLTKTEVGFYKTGMSTVNQIISLVTSATSAPLFSALSVLKTDGDAFEKIYVRYIRAISTFVIPLGVGIFLFQDFITYVLLGSQWMQSNRQIMMRSDIKLPQPFASWSNSL
ncbi:lipopolysaccharide biosynthesis protein [Blautia producta]|uniref:lipopolysaccharide biosynthesis protein n=1 Tax=Blautia producta TaxID=33035 RepID=UPI0035BE5A7F